MQDGGADVACERRLRRGEALQTARGAKAVPLAHEKPEVEGGGLNQDPFSNLLPPADVDAAQPSGHEQVREPPRSTFSPRWRSSSFPRLPWIRRRLS